MELVGTEKVTRARNWTFIFYPEDGKKNWREKLEKLCVPCCVSPLHTPQQGKKHYHIVVAGDKKTELQIYNEICKELGELTQIDGKETIKGVTKPQRIVNLRSAVRYLRHMDNPGKEQFDMDNPIVDYGGFDSSKYTISDSDKKAEKYRGIKSVIKIIRENSIGSLIELLDYLSDDKYQDLFYTVCDNAYLCSQLVNFYVRNQKKSWLTEIEKSI